MPAWPSRVRGERREALHPPEHRGVIDLDPTLEKELCDVAVGETEPQVPAHLPGPRADATVPSEPVSGPTRTIRVCRGAVLRQRARDLPCHLPRSRGRTEHRANRVAALVLLARQPRPQSNHRRQRRRTRNGARGIQRDRSPYFPATRRVSRFVAVPPVRPALAGAPPDQQLAKAANGAEQFDTGPPD